MAQSLNRILLEVVGTSEDAQRALSEAAVRIAHFDAEHAEANVSVDTSAAVRNLDEMSARLRSIDLQHVEPKVAVRIARALAELALLRERIREANRDNVTIGARSKVGAELARDLARAAGEVESLAGGLTRAGSSVGQLGGKAGQTGGMLQQLGATFSSLGAVAVGVAVVLIAALVPALGALVGSLGAALGGVLALGTSFVVALGPAIGFVVALFQRFAAVLAARQAHQQALTAATREGAQATRQDAAEAERGRQAAIGLRDAKQRLQDAEMAYAQAVKQARATIRQAIRDERDAERELADERRNDHQELQRALRDVRDQEGLVTRAIRDYHAEVKASTQEVHDATLSLEGARLDAFGAQLNLNDALAEFNRLIDQIPADRLEGVFQRLRDVAMDPQAVAQFIQAAAKPGSDPNLGSKIVKAYYAVWVALHQVKVAQDDVTKSQQALTAAQRHHADLVKAGIHGYREYRDAVRGLRDALQRLHNVQHDTAESLRLAERHAHDARKALAELRREGVRGMPGVVSAAHAVRDAEQGVRDAMHQVRTAARQAGQSLAASAGPMRTYLSARGKLSKAEREFLDALIATGKGLRTVFGHGTDAVFRALAGLLRTAGRSLAPLRGLFTLMGRDVANGIRALTRALGSTSGQITLSLLGEVARQLVRGGIRAFEDLARIFVHIAIAAAPALLRVLGAFGRWLHGLAESTGRSRTLADTINVLADSLLAWGKLLWEATRAFGAFFRAAAPAGNQLVRWFAGIAKHLADWMNSERGRREIRQFFKDTLPLAKEVLRLVGGLVVAFLKVIQVVGPALTPVVHLLAVLVGVINRALSALAASGLSRALAAIVKLLNPIDTLKRQLKLIGEVLHAIGEIASGHLGRGLRDLGKAILDGILRPIGDLGAKLVAAFKAAVSAVLRFLGIGSPSKLFEGVGKDILRGIVNGITGLPGLLVGAMGTVVRKLGDALDALAGTVSDMGSRLVGWVADGVKGAGAALADAGHWVTAAFWSFFNDGITDLRDAGRWLVDKVKDGVLAARDIMADAGHWVTAAFWSFFNDALNDLRGAGSWLVDKVRDGVRGAGDIVRDAGHWVTGAFWGFFNDALNDLRNAGGWLVDKVRDGVRGSIDIMRDAGHWVAAAFWSFFNDALHDLIAAGRWLVDKVRDGVRGAADILHDAAHWIGGRVLAGIAGIGGLIKAGAHIVRKIASGITGAPKVIWNAAKHLFHSVVNAIKHFFGIGSPSKVFESLGRHMIDGLVRGLDPSRVIHVLGGMKKLVVALLKHGLIGLGQIPKLAAKLGMSALSLAGEVGGNAVDFVKGIVGDVGGFVGGLIPGAKGMFVRGATGALIGEAGPEVVLPLTASVLEALGAAVAAPTMGLHRDLALALAAAVGSAAAPRGGIPSGRPGDDRPNVGELHRHYHIPESPAAHGQPDPLVTAAHLDRLFRQEGGLD